MSVPVDLVVEPLGDLRLSAAGDLGYTNNHNDSVLRRLATPVDGYARFVITKEGVEEIDSEVYSRLYNFLSSPVTELSFDLLEGLVTESLAEDPRVDLLSVDVTTSQLGGSITVDVQYRDTLTEEINTLVVSP